MHEVMFKAFYYKHFSIILYGKSRTVLIISRWESISSYSIRPRKILANYIGHTKYQANRRFFGYRYDMKKATEIPSGSAEGGTELSEHFTSSRHDVKDMRVLLENYYMCKFKTIEPDGLITKHGMFAKLFYNDY